MAKPSLARRFFLAPAVARPLRGWRRVEGTTSMSVIWSDRLVSPPPAAPGRRRRTAAVAPTRVAILGFGTIGRALATLIAHSPACGVSLGRIANRGIERKRVDWIAASVQWSESLDEAVHATDVDIVVELLGGIEPALTCISEALIAGKSVVTANKQVMARHGAALFDLAHEHGVELRCEGAAGGVVPIVRALAEGLRADRIAQFTAVLNGTSNFVLERRARGITLDAAVAEAQNAGIAEANPDADLEGHDAAAKIALLSLFAFGAAIDPESVPRGSIVGIEEADFALAQRLGFALKPVAYAARSAIGVDAFTGPALVSLGSPLAGCHGARNAIVVKGQHSGDTVLAGEGAGGDPTAVAVLSDVLSIAQRGHWQPPVVLPTPIACEAPYLPQVVRLELFNRHEGLPSVIAGLHAYGVRVCEVITLAGDVRAAHVALKLEPCRTIDVQRALAEIERSVPFRARAAVLPCFAGAVDVDGA